MSVTVSVLVRLMGQGSEKFKRRITMVDSVLLKQHQAEETLSGLVTSILAFVANFLKDKDAYEYLKSQDRVKEIEDHTCAMVDALTAAQPDVYRGFTESMRSV